MRFTFGKSEKLTRKSTLEALVRSPHGAKCFPFSLRYLPAETPEGVARQVVFVAPKRNLKRAVDRNLVKRQMRELYRLHKHKINEVGHTEAWSVRYLGNRVNSYAFMEARFLELIALYNSQQNSSNP